MWPKLSVGVESSVRQNLNSECQANHQRERLKGKLGQGARGWRGCILREPFVKGSHELIPVETFTAMLVGWGVLP